MKNVKLSKDEKQLLKAIEAGEFESVLTKKRRAELVSTAKDTVRKDKRINIRISNRDLKAVQLKASEEGIPYQTLVSSVIHKYISGSLKDISANKSLHTNGTKGVGDN
jgi:predicted DNA binding CopG/RHH family protein